MSFLFVQTDTASVLSEAIEYIKFLHDQVNVSLFIYLKEPFICFIAQGRAIRVAS